ncbi:MAG: TlpA family protein disulfide reductase [Rhodospirillales bacterium]|nr:TlpA family protein disulfide reductase [Alphaproteobacteria bacterium]USO03157.1 MAG: TlpA family protein disulfide reductase [Rhodospirillales bacterium]
MNAKIFIGLTGFCIFAACVAAGHYWPARRMPETPPVSAEGGAGSQDIDSSSVAVPETLKHFAGRFHAVRAAPRSLPPVPKLYFTGPEGQKRSLREFKGRYTLLNIWVSWCGPCVIELPSLEELKKHYEGKNLEVVAISVDSRRTISVLKEFLKTRGIDDFALNRDSRGEIQAHFSPRGIPISYLLGPDGRLLYTFEGDTNWVSPSALAFFDDLLD